MVWLGLRDLRPTRQHRRQRKPAYRKASVHPWGLTASTNAMSTGQKSQELAWQSSKSPKDRLGWIVTEYPCPFQGLGLFEYLRGSERSDIQKILWRGQVRKVIINPVLNQLTNLIYSWNSQLGQKVLRNGFFDKGYPDTSAPPNPGNQKAACVVNGWHYSINNPK